MSDDWQVVEEGIGNAPHLTTERYAAVNAALARLREREAQLESTNRAQLAGWTKEMEMRRYAEDHAKEQERLRLISVKPSYENLIHRAEAAEARVKELEEALRDVVDVAIWLTGATDLTDVPAWPEMREKLLAARRALAHEEEALS